MHDDLNWAVLGTGVIANEMAQALQKMGKSLYAVANRTHQKAIDFAEKYQIEKVYDQIDDMFEDENVDIIYLTSPHNTHYAFMKKALEHGKHLLVEKSITLNSRELQEMIDLAKEKNLVLAEAMTIWHMPIYKKLWEIVKNKDLGKVQIITMNFGSFKEYDMNNRFFNMNLAGGAMLDIGVYALSIVRSFMDETPDEIVSQWKPSPTGSDEQATILLKNSLGQMATVALSMHSKQPKRAMISCEKGYIEIMEYPRASKAILVDAETGKQTELDCGDTANALYYEMTDMEQAVKNKICTNKNGIDKNSADKNDTNKNSESNEQNEQDEMRLFRNMQAFLQIVAGCLQCFSFRFKQRRVEHHAITDDIYFITLENSRRNGTEHIFLTFKLQCMTGVRATLKTCHHIVSRS